MQGERERTLVWTSWNSCVVIIQNINRQDVTIGWNSVSKEMNCKAVAHARPLASLALFRVNLFSNPLFFLYIVEFLESCRNVNSHKFTWQKFSHSTLGLVVYSGTSE